MEHKKQELVLKTLIKHLLNNEPTTNGSSAALFSAGNAPRERCVVRGVPVVLH